MKYTASHLPHDMPNTFADLNGVHPLRPIADDVDLENATAVMDRLAVLDRPTKDQQDYLETLTILIERYESAHGQEIDLSGISGLDMLKHILETTGMKQGELASLLGVGAPAVSMILADKRAITVEHARKLGRHFAVDPGLFI